jgi:membrane-bound ClpP family serine protease
MGWIIFLLALGLLLLLLELFVTPGVLIGIFGIIAWAAAIFQVYKDYGVSAGNWLTLGMMLLLVGGVVWGLKTNLWSKVTIHTNVDGRMNEVKDFNPEPGMKGKSLSALRPSGTGRFNDSIVEVTTFGEFISQEEAIEIVAFEDRKIFVKKV